MSTKLDTKLDICFLPQMKDAKNLHILCRFNMYKDIVLVPNRYVNIHAAYFKNIGYYYFRVTGTKLIGKEVIGKPHVEELLMNVLDAPCYPPKVGIYIFFFIHANFCAYKFS